MCVVTEPCILDMLTYMSTVQFVTSCHPQHGSVTMNGRLVWEGYYCFDPKLRRRATNLLLIDPSTCTLRTDPITFETDNVNLGTFPTSLHPPALLQYLNVNLTQGDVVAGLSFDDAMFLIKDNETLKQAFRANLGIELEGLTYRDSFAFIAQKGYLGKKVFETVPAEESKTNPARLKIAVTGTGLDIVAV